MPVPLCQCHTRDVSMCPWLFQLCCRHVSVRGCVCASFLSVAMTVPMFVSVSVHASVYVSVSLVGLYPCHSVPGTCTWPRAIGFAALSSSVYGGLTEFVSESVFVSVHGCVQVCVVCSSSCPWNAWICPKLCQSPSSCPWPCRKSKHYSWQNMWTIQHNSKWILSEIFYSALLCLLLWKNHE